MEDYFLRILIRQRHEEISREIKAARRTRRQQHERAGGGRKNRPRFLSFLHRRKKLSPPRKPALSKRTGI